MFSGHLAQLSVLYETFSGDDTLSRAGFRFNGLQQNYSIDTLFHAIRRNGDANGEITCNELLARCVDT